MLATRTKTGAKLRMSVQWLRRRGAAPFIYGRRCCGGGGGRCGDCVAVVVVIVVAVISVLLLLFLQQQVHPQEPVLI